MITRKYNKNNLMMSILVLVGLFAILISISCVSAASTVYVNTSGNDISGNGSADNPFLTIQKGIDSIDEKGTVNIGNGQYSGTGNTKIYINKNMTIKGQSQTGTIINGTDTNWIFQIQSGANVTIVNLTLTNGTTTGQGGTIYNTGNLTVKNCTFTGNAAQTGGAIYNFQTSNLTVTGSTFTNNKASNIGGAIFNGVDSHLAVTGSTFTNNSAASAVFGGGAIYGYGNLTVTGSTFTNNNAINGGGAILSNNGANLAIAGSTFSGNTANWGGAIYSGYGNLTITSSTFTGNNVANYGGAIYNDNNSNLTITNSEFTGNTANGNGGAIYNLNTLTVTGSTFTGNTATHIGGAIYNDGTLTVTNSNFKDNNADWGGAIYNGGTGSTLTVTSSTFNSNHATIDGGGAIWNEANNTVTGCTFTGNTAEDMGGAIGNDGTLIVTGSTFTNNTATSEGGAICTYPDLGYCTVTGSTFTDNHANYGGAIYNGGNLTVTGSTFTGNTATYGGIIANWSDVIAHFNRIVGNTASQGSDIYYGGGAVDAKYNWWGSNNSPDTTRFFGTVDYSHWLILTVTASPGTIYTGSTSQIIADLTHDNTGIYHDPANEHVPDGIQVNFATNLGTISSPLLTVNGIAQSTLNGGLVAGTANVSAAVDSQTVNALVTVLLDTTHPTVNVNYKTGLYNTAKSITLTTTDPDSKTTTYYTIDGSNPQTSSTRHIYSIPISITSTKTLKYSAIDLTGNWSPIYIQTYTIDKTAPKVISTYPKNYATGVSRTATMAIKFSENIKAGVNWSKVYVKNLTTRKIAVISKWISGNTLYIKMSLKRYAYNWYQVYIPAGAIKDYAGNYLFTSYTFKFKTGKY